MKQRSLRLTLAMGLVAGLFACQDQSVVAPISPDDLIVAAKKPLPVPEVPTATLTLEGAVTGESEPGWNWSTKKGIFSANGPMGFTIDFSDAQKGACESPLVEPAGADPGPLKAALMAGLAGKSAVLKVDIDGQGAPSEVNRITVLVESEPVRYFWIGPSGEFDYSGDDATVLGFSEGAETITYTISGGVIGVRDTASPKKAVKIACPFLGNVTVTLNKN